MESKYSDKVDDQVVKKGTNLRIRSLGHGIQVQWLIDDQVVEKGH